jgi:hypothetical protein
MFVPHRKHLRTSKASYEDSFAFSLPSRSPLLHKHVSIVSSTTRGGECLEADWRSRIGSRSSPRRNCYIYSQVCTGKYNCRIRSEICLPTFQPQSLRILAPCIQSPISQSISGYGMGDRRGGVRVPVQAQISFSEDRLYWIWSPLRQPSSGYGTPFQQVKVVCGKAFCCGYLRNTLVTMVTKQFPTNVRAVSDAAGIAVPEMRSSRCIQPEQATIHISIWARDLYFCEHPVAYLVSGRLEGRRKFGRRCQHWWNKTIASVNSRPVMPVLKRTSTDFIDAFWEGVPCSSSSNKRFGENIASIFRDSQHDRIPQLCCHRIAVDQPLHRGLPFMLEEKCLLGCFHGGRKGTETEAFTTCSNIFPTLTRAYRSQL